MSPTQIAEAPPTPAWRYKAGLSLFIIGNVLTLASLVVVPALGLSAAYIGAAVIVGEVRHRHDQRGRDRQRERGARAL